jgi:TolA-binding protein
MNKPTTVDDLFDLFAAKEISFNEVLNQSGKSNAEEVKEELQLHLLAAGAVKRYAIQQQVAEIHKMYAPAKVQEIASNPAPVKILPAAGAGKWMMRIAASVALLIGLYTTQYVVFFSPDKMYKSTFSEYYVNTERSTSSVTENEISAAFRKGDFGKVVSLYANNKEVSAREKFLTGYSHIQLNNFSEAEMLFSEILQTNQQNGINYFQDEAEYYLAMVQLKLGKTENARILLEKIHANKEHTFYESVSNWMIFRMKFY